MGLLNGMENAGTTRPGILLELRRDVSTSMTFTDHFPLGAFAPVGDGTVALSSPLAFRCTASAGVPTLWDLVARNNQVWVGTTAGGGSRGTLGDTGSGAELEVSPSVQPMAVGQFWRIESLVIAVS